MKYNTCSRVSSYINEVYSYGCKLLIDKPTRITHSTASCIDHFYTNDQVNKIKIGILINDITDHLPLLINIRTHTHKIQPEKYKYRSFKNFDLDLFLEDVSKSMASLEQTFNAISPIKDDFTLFKNVFIDIINMHAPLREATKKQRNFHKKPWMTKAIFKSINTKNKLFKRYITSSNKDDHSKYKKYRNKLNHIICAAKSNYYNNAAIKYKSNSREMWNLINEIIQNRRLQIREKIRLKSNEKLIEDSHTIANKFNTFFSEIASKMAGQVKVPIQPEPKRTKSPMNSFQLTEITPDEIVRIITKLNEKKSTQVNDIPTKFLKFANALIAPILSKMYNKCIREGIFPENLKTAQIIPVYKKNSKYDCTNYRPISLLSQLSKIFEKLLAQRITNYLLKFNLLSQCQYGFREGYSTTSAIADIYDELLSNRDHKLHTCAIFLDLQKAFDSVDHKILIEKLERNFGIRGNPLKLLKSYLTDRKQYTTVNKVNSSHRTVKMGIPQGSTLGPLFFLLFINDLPLASSFKTTLFADDAMLSISSTSMTNLELKTNLELSKVENWLRHNKLSLNLSKTNYLLIQNKSRLEKGKIKLKVNDSPLKQSSVVKYLGVYIDDNLNWSAHIQHLQKQVSRSTALLSKLRHYVNIKVRCAVCYSLIHSHLNYGIAVYGSANKTVLKKLQIIQNNIMRIITFSSFRQSAKPLFKQLKILNIESMSKLELAKIMHGCNNGQIPVRIEQIFTKSSKVHQYNTRQTINDGFFIPRIYSQSGKKSLQYRGSKLWNSIPSKIKKLPLSSFKKEYSLILLKDQ